GARARAGRGAYGVGGPSRPPLRSKMKTMKVRWTIAAVSALALALLTLNNSEMWEFAAAHAAHGGACPANAKPANLNFTLKDVNGKDVKLSSFKGNVILL